MDMNTDIHDALTVLETQLSSLKTASEHIGESAAAAKAVVATVDAILHEFRASTESIRSHYENKATSVTAFVTESVESLADSHKQQIGAVRELLVQAEELAKGTSMLVESVKSVDFPVRFGELERELRTNTMNVERALSAMDVPGHLSRIRDNLGAIETILTDMHGAVAALRSDSAATQSAIRGGFRDATSGRQQATESIATAMRNAESNLLNAVQEGYAKLEAESVQRFEALQKKITSRANVSMIVFTVLCIVQLAVLLLLYLR